jgi:hypothetical protein
MRYNDIRDGTNKVEDVLKKYEASLIKKGMLNDSGLYPSFFALKQRKALPAKQGAHTAWYDTKSLFIASRKTPGALVLVADS